MNFDEIIDRRGSHCVKWDMMESLYGVSPDDGIAMWVADMDFAAPDCVQAVLRDMVEHGVYGYFGDDRAYKDAVRWWQAERRGWPVHTHALEQREETELVREQKGGRDEIKRLADIFRAKIIDVTEVSYVVELTGSASKLDAFLRTLSEDLIVEVVRSGPSGMALSNPRLAATTHFTALSLSSGRLSAPV